MIDIKRIRENPEAIIASINSRQSKDYTEEVKAVLKVDEERREVAGKRDGLKAQQNNESKAIPQLMKEGKKEEAEKLKAELKKIADEIKEYDAQLTELEAKQEEILLAMPNTPDPSVPIGPDETANVEQRRWGTPRDFAKEGFEPKAHWDLGKDLDILDPDRAAKVTGARFHFYKGEGAHLERAIINFYLDLHTTKQGYTEMLPPFIVNGDSMRGTSQLPKFKEDMYKVSRGDGDSADLDKSGWYLVPTAEVPVTNYYRGEILRQVQQAETQEALSDSTNLTKLKWLNLPARISHGQNLKALHTTQRNACSFWACLTELLFFAQAIWASVQPRHMTLKFGCLLTILTRKFLHVQI